ncbi:MAG: dihydropteroate synthase [Candidatus Methylacidiphilales bacterium]
MTSWHHSRGELLLGNRPALMGILNVTPDSFSDGGRYDQPDAALAHAIEMLGAGADIIDIGGESTRPGSLPVSAQTECTRILPVIQGLVQERPDALISIDTTKAEVARAALRAGACIVNDISGGLWDPEMVPVVREHLAGYVCTHSLDRPAIMQHDPHYPNVVFDVRRFLEQRKCDLLDHGLEEKRLCFDVGIGFGKTAAHNLALIRAGAAGGFQGLDRPMLWGLSRKSFIEKTLNRPTPDRLAGGLAAHAVLLTSLQPQIWRVHDVRASMDFIEIYRALASPTDRTS